MLAVPSLAPLQLTGVLLLRLRLTGGVWDTADTSVAVQPLDGFVTVSV